MEPWACVTTVYPTLLGRNVASVASVENVENVLDKDQTLSAISHDGPVTRAWVLELDSAQKVP